LPLSFIFERYILTGSERSLRHNRQSSSNNRTGFKSVVVRKLVRSFGVTSLYWAQRMTNDALFGSNIAIVTRQRRRRPTSDTDVRHYFSLNEWLAVARARIWETQNYVGFIPTDESLLSSWPPYPSCPLSTVPHLPATPLFRTRARVTIPHEPVIFTPKWVHVIQLHNDNKDNSDKNNCYCNEESHGVGSDLLL